VHKSTCRVLGDTYNERASVDPRVNTYFIEECVVCDGPLIYFVEDDLTDGNAEIDLTRAMMVFPDGGDLPNSVPIEIARYYKRAVASMNSAPDDFAYNVRKGLEAICINKRVGTESEPLVRRIEVLVSQEDLPPLVEKMVQALRKVGNFGAHVSVEPKLMPEHVPAIFLFFNTVIKYVYVLPDEVHRFERYLTEVK